jgi:hypothetical protein
MNILSFTQKAVRFFLGSAREYLKDLTSFDQTAKLKIAAKTLLTMYQIYVQNLYQEEIRNLV